jgi:hypothetical protein
VDDFQFNTAYLNDYLAMVEDSESPRLFHIWQAVFNISCSLGRRCWFPFGPMQLYPNQYVLLVGTPGTRKSTAASMGKRILKANTGVRMAPQDTAGQRQGLVTAMQGESQAAEFLNAARVGGNNGDSLSLADIAEITNDPAEETAQFVSEADKHHMAVISGEFSRFIGQNNISMLDFLATMWDGDDYDYQLKTSKITLKNPLLNVLGCTTPTSISHSMPPAAGGQGFLSRVILVYGAKKYKSVPRPGVPPQDMVDRVGDRIKSCYYDLAGPFDETPQARAYSEGLYDYKIDIADSRFGYYAERRYTHLIKLATCLAAAGGRRIVEKDDFEEAHRILRATEQGMPDALGEFGMNPLAVVKQEILEELRGALGPIPMNALISMFTRDARSHDVAEVINDLKRAGHIRMIQGTDGGFSVSANFNKASVEQGMMRILAKLDKVNGDS